MHNKVGSIVMIDPKTGEVLCMVSSPTYDPALLTGKAFSANYRQLENNPYKPLINRAIAGTYPPGSTFKPTQGLIFLQEGIIDTETRFSCYGGYPPWVVVPPATGMLLLSLFSLLSPHHAIHSSVMASMLCWATGVSIPAPQML